jgi:hypothetical protein
MTIGLIEQIPQPCAIEAARLVACRGRSTSASALTWTL